MTETDPTVKLSDLVGKHWLSGVDFEKEQDPIYHYECDATVMRFCLDGVVYAAVEDPDDGYRSCLKDIRVIPGGSMDNTFASVRVYGRMRTDPTADEILELIDAVGGGVVLEVGTTDISDYYPGFVARFHPENMAPNLHLNKGMNYE